MNPRNQGEIPDPDLVLETGSIAEGNAVKLMLKFDEQQRISEARFQSFGACESIAVFSVLTEMLLGKTAPEAAAISEKDILKYVWGATALPMFETERAIALMRQACWQERSAIPKRQEMSPLKDLRGLPPDAELLHALKQLKG